MASEVEFQDEGVRDFLLNLEKKLKQVENGHLKYAVLISSVIFRDVMEHFSKEEGPEGKWEPWSFWHTIQMERAGKGGNKILQDTGRLRQSFIPSNYRTSSEGILWYNNAVTKSGFAYAAAHDEGGGKLPARPFMWASKSAIDSIEEKTLQFMLDEGI